MKQWYVLYVFLYSYGIILEITGNLNVCSAVSLNWHQRKHQMLASLALCEGNPPVTGGFPSQRASNVEHVCSHDIIMLATLSSQTMQLFNPSRAQTETVIHCVNRFLHVIEYACHTWPYLHLSCSIMVSMLQVCPMEPSLCLQPNCIMSLIQKSIILDNTDNTS